MKILLVMLVTMGGIFEYKANAHPVSFAGSVGLMGYHSKALTHGSLNYSFTYDKAIAVHHFRRPWTHADMMEDPQSMSDGMPQRAASFASGNFLLKRWNAPKLQANLYTVLGYGRSSLVSGNGEYDPAVYSTLQFDIEDRDYYFLAKAASVISDNRYDMLNSLYRVGITPYVEAYDGIHSWIIFEWNELQFFNQSAKRDLTAFVRVFYKNVLVEVGQSFEGHSKFNYIVHF